MNVFHKVTLQMLRKNKMRTIVTIVGIILSAAMICAVTTCATSFQRYAQENAKYEDGNWHGGVKSTSKEKLDAIKNAADVEKVVYAEQLGYALLENCDNKEKPYLYVLGAGRDFEEVMPIHITSGRYPETVREILLPDHLADNGGVVYKVGDVLTITLSERMSEGHLQGQDNPYYYYDIETGDTLPPNETLEPRETVTYTVVGFYERPDFEPWTAPGYTALTLADAKEATGRYDVYFRLENPSEIYDFMKDNGLVGEHNTNLLMFYGVSGYEGFYTVLYGLAGIVIGLIMFGSISLIYNAFSISVSERTKQFGLLSSVGATKRQLRKMVLFEAFVVSAVGIPLGILAGIGGIGVTLWLIGDKFAFMGSMQVPMRLVVSPVAVIVAILVALITVLLSAWIPSKRAMKVTAVEAIRQNADIKVSGRAVKSSRLVQKLFGLPGTLANKHFKRNKKKYRATIASLFMSIVLFVSASAFTTYLTESVMGSFGSAGYDLELMRYEKEGIGQKELYQRLMGTKGTTAGTYLLCDFVPMLLEPKAVNKEYYTLWKAEIEKYNLEAPKDGRVEIMTNVLFVEDSAFDSYVKEHGLDREQFYNQESPKAIAFDQFVGFNVEKERFTTQYVFAGESITADVNYMESPTGYEYYEAYLNEDNETILVFVNTENSEDTKELKSEDCIRSRTVEIAEIRYDRPYFVADAYYPSLVYPYSMATAVLPENVVEGMPEGYYFLTDDHATAYEEMKQILIEEDIDMQQFTNYAEMEEENRNIITIIKVFSYGFIVLISLVAAANVFNTISTNLALRRREFAMLRSVGMTQKGIRRMLNFECLLYGTKALLLGLPVALGITYLIHLSVNAGYDIAFQVPYKAMGIVTLSVFAVVFVTMLYSMGKIRKDNPMDALKNENL